MSINVTSQEAAAKFPQLLQQVLHGEEIIIADEGTELARVVPSAPKPLAKNPRIPGIDKGKVFLAPDFDDPLPEELLRAFEGAEDITP